MRAGIIVTYDGSWLGVFTLVFQVYAHRWDVKEIVKSSEKVQAQLFADITTVITDEQLANRVLKSLRESFGNELVQELYYVFLSELPEADLLLLKAVQFYFAKAKDPNYQKNIKGSNLRTQAGGGGVRHNYAEDTVLQVQQIGRSVSRERHRMKAFIRFEKMNDGLYVAFIAPDFNVLPLIIKHFRDRYTDQCWLIYDVKRNFGAYYNLQAVEEIVLEDGDQGQAVRAISWDAEEALYSDLWKRYFRAVNIKERKNMKLHIQEVPRRYWKYLTEKK